MEKYFINEAFDKAINDYLNSKEHKEGIVYNSFLVVVIRLLINIYSELDIINPFQIKNEVSLDDNLMKYGAKKEEIKSFKLLCDGFYKVDERNKNSIKREDNIYFVEIQKRLIDLLKYKVVELGYNDEEEKAFFDLLYTPATSNALRMSYNYLMADDIYEVAVYYQKTINHDDLMNHRDKKDLLNFEIYKYFGISISDLAKMSKQQISELNESIYRKMDISINTMNKEYLLQEKIKSLKKEKELLTSGNGYVDILIIMSIIVTVILVILVFITIIF